ncbi:dihydrofolate reductase family protein [Phytomonospora endophytica]|uniref:Dihydrofolate reductase n=1 Tax=Phytomonospora endophytica TaxID=714109 RepID=A0A841G0X2_9ACTN|nr:dihydrofolate reductase family protein [Phytomonospora endophytica]MBB6039578.1 dihydrofolate reductase [Phytomonospora endophytica]GIG70544.1 deaminase reductase [Phytomonospora endophytica]
MSKVYCDMAMSLDGYAAGPHQSKDNPFGENIFDRLLRWRFEEADQHTTVVDKITDAGAFIMGRNMFGPDRGDWDLDWTGWWGDNPPYHAPVFVLAHRTRPSITMEGGTVFHFVTDGIHAALEQARAVAGDRDVSIAGGAHTANQYLAAGLIDELRLHIAPIVVGHGERLLADVGSIDLTPLDVHGTKLVTHITYRVNR